MNVTSIASYIACLVLATGVAIVTSSCQNGSGSDPAEKPLVDQTEVLGSGLSRVHLQIVPRKVRHSGGANPAVSGTFDLVVQVDLGRLQRFDLGVLIGSGDSKPLTFQDKTVKLIMQDLNHDGTKDTNILHDTDGHALISFDAKGRPYRLKFDGEPTGGFAKPKDIKGVGVLSTEAFRLIPKGFRYQSDGIRVDAIWNPKAGVFVFDA